MQGMERLLSIRYEVLEVPEGEQEAFVRDVREARAKTRRSPKRKDASRIRDLIRGMSTAELLDLQARLNGS